MLDEPLDPQEAKRLLLDIIEAGGVRFTRHAKLRLGERNLTEIDCVNVLRGGVVEEAEPSESRSGGWCYRVRSYRINVVVAFRSESVVAVVSAWRMQR